MAAAAYISAVLVDVPKAFYKCQDASGLPQDASGNALHMTGVNGTPVYQQTGPMVDFGIKYASATVDNHFRAVVTAVVDNLTLELWYRPTTLGTANATIVGNNNGGTNGYEIITPTSGKFALVCQGVGIQANCAATLVAGVWYHIAICRRAGTWEYYLNGTVDTNNAGTAAPLAPAPQWTSHNRAGDGNFTVAYYALYETALTADRISAHYLAGIAAGANTIFRGGRGSAW